MNGEGLRTLIGGLADLVDYPIGSVSDGYEVVSGKEWLNRTTKGHRFGTTKGRTDNNNLETTISAKMILIFFKESGNIAIRVEPGNTVTVFRHYAQAADGQTIATFFSKNRQVTLLGGPKVRFFQS